MDPWLISVVLAGGLVQGVLGFGFGLLVMAVLPAVLGLREAVILVALLALVLNLGALIRFRRSLRGEELWPLLFGALLGVPLGVSVLLGTDPSLLLRILGGLLLAYALHALLLPPRGGGRPLSRAFAVPAGFVGGAFGAGFNTGGPPLVAYGTARRLEPEVFKAVMQACFLGIGTLQVLLFHVNGQIHTGQLERLAWLVPAVLIGMLLGAFGARWIRAEAFRSLVLLVLALLGFRYLVGG